jgi:hypothetical protein
VFYCAAHYTCAYCGFSNSPDSSVKPGNGKWIFVAHKRATLEAPFMA